MTGKGEWSQQERALDIRCAEVGFAKPLAKHGVLNVELTRPQILNQGPDPTYCKAGVGLVASSCGQGAEDDWETWLDLTVPAYVESSGRRK